MTRIKSYDNATVSVFDIKEWLEKKGYNTLFIEKNTPLPNNKEARKRKGIYTSDKYVLRYSNVHVLNVENTDVYIDIPLYIDSLQTISSHIRYEQFNLYPEESKKVYQLLVRKFGVGKWNEDPQKIKDWDKIVKFLKEQGVTDEKYVTLPSNEETSIYEKLKFW